MALADFFVRLERADWYYEMSDDPAVRRRGRIEEEALAAEAKTSPAHQKLYDDYVAYKNAFGDLPKPEKPA